MVLKLFITPCLFVLLFLSGLIASAQTRTCGMEDYMNTQLQDPDYIKAHQKNQTEFRVALAQRLKVRTPIFNRSNPIIIPVAVHFPEAQEADRACLEALAQNQIDILNADYTATNSDFNLWSTASSFYPGINSGSVNIEF